MQVKPLYRDPITGYLREAQSGDSLNTSTQAIFNEYVTLFDDTTVLTCCALVESTAISINSANLPLTQLRNSPVVDCIILETGIRGQTVLAALTHGKKYATIESIVYSDSDTLYLGRNGKVTTTQPSLINGDSWLVKIGRLVNHNEFIFDPEPPIDLNSNNGYSGTIPSLPGYPDTWLFNDGAALSWKKIRMSDIAAVAAITSFNASQNLFEVGQQINTPSFMASYNDVITSARLRDNQNFVWQVLGNDNSFNSNYNFKLNSPGSVIFSLEAHTLTDILTSATSLNWYYRKFYGTSTNPNLTDISSLGYNGLSSSRAGSLSVNANTNEYIYLAIPVSFGNPGFNVGGFDGGFQLSFSNVNITNNYGITIQYNIWRSDNHSLGITTVLVS